MREHPTRPCTLRVRVTYRSLCHLHCARGLRRCKCRVRSAVPKYDIEPFLLIETLPVGFADLRFTSGTAALRRVLGRAVRAVGVSEDNENTLG